MFKQISYIFNEYKILRGIASYAILWPVGSIIEQTLVEKKNWQTIHWKKCLRFGIYGAIIMGPTMYVWVRTAAIIWPKPGFRSSVSKAICEQFSVDPVLICTFLFVMSLLEKKTIAEANAEVHDKFLDTYRVGVVYWPTVQTINFTFVPLKNQVVCTSFFSMLWSSFLSYEKHKKMKQQHQSEPQTQTQIQENYGKKQ